ncbi:hypothetical protein D3C81_1448010 [compost metagenome]
MLPHVQAEDRRVAVHQRAVLVAAAFHHQGFLRRYAKPGPAAAEAGQRCLGEGFLEGLETAQLRSDGLRQLALRLTPALRRHHGPEQAVVGVPATMVGHRATQVFRQLLDRAEQFFHRPFSPLGAFDGGVKAVDVGLVVLGVMDFHGLRVDVRLQRSVGVRQCRQGMGHVSEFRRHGF